MNIGVILKKDVKLTAFSDREILRYAGIKGDASFLVSLIEECKAEIEGIIKSTVVYRIVPFSKNDELCDFSFCSVKSKHLSKAMEGASFAVVMAATLGIDVDRLIHKYSRISAAKAHIVSAVAAERIEALCDAFCREIDNQLASEGLITDFRFSPGYGDLSLDFQKKIFSVLEPSKHIGLTLNESLIMSPSKSVSAIVAVKRKKNDIS